jgi:perosamine synthetase
MAILQNYKDLLIRKELKKNKMIHIAKPFIDEKEVDAVTKVIRSGIIAQGPVVKELEQKFAEYIGVKHAVMLNSGTAALHAALAVAGIKKGDEVITTPFSFVATANTILMVGAKPIFADISNDDFNIDFNKIKEKITDKTKAIIAVDLYGQIANYEEIEPYCKENDIVLITDSCQAIASEQNGKKAGAFGDMGTFSFYATKNICCGEGGFLTTNNDEYAHKVRLFRQHGRKDMIGYDYASLGYNYRSTDINAAILMEQLKKVDFITNKRISNAKFLTENLSKIEGIKTPVINSGNKHCFHQYTIIIDDDFKLSRDDLIKYLKDKGVGCAIYYPQPIHLATTYQNIGYRKGDYPISEEMCKRVISLPVHPNLSKEELDKIVKVFEEI